MAGVGFDSHYLGDLYVLRWKAPTLPDVESVEREVQVFSQGRPKRHLVGLAIIGVDTTPPDDRTRSAMGKAMKGLLQHLNEMHVVIEGEGFKHSILRSAMTGVILVSRQRGHVNIHRSISDAIPALSRGLSVSVSRIKEELGEFLV